MNIIITLDERSSVGDLQKLLNALDSEGIVLDVEWDLPSVRVKSNDDAPPHGMERPTPSEIMLAARQAVEEQAIINAGVAPSRPASEVSTGNALSVGCPYCQEPAGFHCKQIAGSASGHRLARPHLVRQQRAARLYRERMVEEHGS